MNEPQVVNLREKLGKFQEYWSPRVVAEMNEYQFKVVKLKGEFVWHQHEDTDEAFLVLEGEMEIGLRLDGPEDGDPALRDRTVRLRAGELFVVPRGMEHITRAAGECQALILEPRGVVNTGDAGGALTAANDVWV
jgi:mannose-6-phosphate isomerase-like protein (cupin superfamily)